MKYYNQIIKIILLMFFLVVFFWLYSPSHATEKSQLFSFVSTYDKKTDLIRQYARDNKYDKVVEEYQKLIVQDTTTESQVYTWAAKWQLGKLYLERLKDYDKALAIYQELEANADRISKNAEVREFFEYRFRAPIQFIFNTVLPLYLGDCYKGKGQNQEAAHCYAEAIKTIQVWKIKREALSETERQKYKTLSDIDATLAELEKVYIEVK